LLNWLHFLRQRLTQKGYAGCIDLRSARNGSRLAIAGLVLVRQMPGSAKGVMFITLEDESANANLIVWPSVFAKFRRVILSGSMFGVRGRVQHASDVIHLIVEEVVDLTPELKSIAGLDASFPLPSGRGDEAKGGGSGPDSRDPKPQIIRPRDMYEPDLHIDTLKVKARNFH
jgi:error-prone DNA polymerase